MREYLKKLREEKNISQQNVEERTGLSQQYYSLIEIGERQADMSLSVMKKLSEAFDVPLEFIIEEEMKLKKTTA